MNTVELLRNVVQVAPQGKHYLLKSGETSRTYVDVRMVSLSSTGLRTLVGLLWDRIQELGWSPDLIGGVISGGCPLATGISLLHGLDALYVRSKKKEYGTSKSIEGTYKERDRIVLLEDVVTTGGSVLRAVQYLKTAGLNVAVLGVLDREQGAREKIEHECPYSSLASISELFG